MSCEMGLSPVADLVLRKRRQHRLMAIGLHEKNLAQSETLS
jgi:hypothetical protein